MGKNFTIDDDLPVLAKKKVKIELIILPMANI